MKKIILLVLILLNLKGVSQTAWIEQQMENIFLHTPSCVKFVDLQTGIIVGRYGTFSRTTNGGVNWLHINNYLYNHYNTITFINNYTGWVAGDSNGVEMIRKTTNSGASWDSTYFNSGSTIKVIQFLNNQTGYAASSHVVKKSVNGGLNWTVLYDMGVNYTNYALYFVNISTGWVSSTYYNPYTYVFTTNLVKTTNGGQNWITQFLDSSYSNITCNYIQFVNDSLGYISRTSLGVYKTLNGGNSWSNIQGNSSYCLYFIDNNTGWLGSEYYIRKTTNGGMNWVSESVIERVFFSSIYFVNGLTGWAVGSTDQTYPRIYKTTNGGVLFYYSISGSVRYSDNNQPATGGYVKAIKLDKNTGNIITFDSVQIQANGNYTLTNVPQDSVDIGVYPNSSTQNDWVMTYYPSTIYWQNATTIYPTGNLTNINVGVYRLTSTTNNNSVNGKVMRLNDNPSLANLKDAVLYAKSGNSFVRCGISDASGVYHLPSLPAGSLKIICNRLGFTGDSATVNVTSTSNIDSINFYLYKLSVGIKQIGSVIPSEYRLYQNYPNPFNPSTNIKYQIQNSKLVILKVYDIPGKEVATLVNENQPPGVYEVTFDAGSLPSGVYFYKLTAGDFSEVKRMVLIK